eukprot:7186939-Heterocapsa_arctica.AAC.1
MVDLTHGNQQEHQYPNSGNYAAILTRENNVDYAFPDDQMHECNAERTSEQQADEVIVIKCSFDRTTYVQQTDLTHSDSIGLP